MQEREHIILLGDVGVGKTTFVERFLSNRFRPVYCSTISVTSHEVDRFEIWDTSGQERYRGSNDHFYKRANGAIIFADLTSKMSIKNVSNWLKKIGTLL